MLLSTELLKQTTHEATLSLITKVCAVLYQEPITRRSVGLVELAFRTSYLRCEAFFPYKAVHVTPTIKTAVVAVITSCTAFYFCAFQIRKYRLNFLSGLVRNTVLLRLLEV